MFKREKDRLHRDKEKVEKELQRKRVENDKIFQRKKDFDWMINELFEEGRSEQSFIRKLLDSLRQIRGQLENWEGELKDLAHEDDKLRVKLAEQRKSLVEKIVDKEAQKQLLEVQVRLVEEDMAQMKSGTLTSLRQKLSPDQAFDAEKKCSFAQDFPAEIEHRENAELEAARSRSRGQKRVGALRRNRPLAGQEFPSQAAAEGADQPAAPERQQVPESRQGKHSVLEGQDGDLGARQSEPSEAGARQPQVEGLFHGAQVEVAK